MKRRLFCVPFHRFRGDNFQHKMSTHHLLVRKTVLPFEIPHQSSSSRSRHDEFSCWVTTQNSPTNTASFDRSNEVWRHLTCGVIVWWCNSVRWPEFKVTKRTGKTSEKTPCKGNSGDWQPFAWETIQNSLPLYQRQICIWLDFEVSLDFDSFTFFLFF